MPYPPSHREQVKEKIIESARRLFNCRGFNAVSIDDVMAEAGLTRGSFYTYFDSKSALFAESVTRFVSEKRATRAESASIDARAPGVAAKIARNYLSHRQFDHADEECPMIGLATDVGLTDPQVRLAFEGALRLMVDIFEQGMRRKGEEARPRALAISALCVGGLVVARSIEDRVFADEVREAALAIALSLGNWT